MINPRKPYQGIKNIIRFNWHYYVFSITIIGILWLIGLLIPGNLRFFLDFIVFLFVLGILFSLAASHYIYDRTNLYSLAWLNFLTVLPGSRLVNINAGFDEISALLAEKYPYAELLVFDFYDSGNHTELSIERARKLYAPYPGTAQIQTDAIPIEKSSTDIIFLILTAHEIRNRNERVVFFYGLAETLKKTGRIVVVEHLRDLPNFIAFNIGFFHFYSSRSWEKIFRSAGLILERTVNLNPFISAFILTKHGTAS